MKNDRILRICRGELVDRTPIWIMRQAGRYLPEFREFRVERDFFQICRTPEMACEVTLQPLRRFDLDCSIIFSDIMVVPQAMELECIMVPGKGPTFPKPLEGPECLDRINLSPDVKTSLKYVYDAITLTRKRIEGQCPLFGFCGAPWTLMAYMTEGGGSKTYSKAKKWLYQHEEASNKLLDAITNTCIEFLIEQANAGAQLLQVFESHADALTPELFERYTQKRLKFIASEVKRRLGDKAVPMSIFCKGAHFMNNSFLDSEYDIIQVDWTITADQISQLKGKVVQGNLDPCQLYAPKDEIKTSTRKMLQKFKNQRHIANLGHGIYPDTDPEHLRAYIDAVHEISQEYLKN